MGEREAMLQAICAAPGDDLPRLAFADWLEDSARPPEPERAEFIRVQIEREAVESIEHTCRPHPDGGPDEGETECAACGAHWVAEDLRNREREILERIAERVAVPILDTLWPHTAQQVGWDGVVTAFPTGQRAGGHVRFRRGFLWGVTCAAPKWVASVSEIAWHPDWSVPCASCEDKAPDWETNVVECRRCDSTGYVGQPCPAEPQPVERVTLTTRPDLRDYPEGFARREGGGWEHARWPGIRFFMPGESPA